MDRNYLHLRFDSDGTSVRDRHSEAWTVRSCGMRRASLRPRKTLTGILRDAAEWIADVRDAEKGNKWKNA